jgi:hypothetical protein
MIYYRSVIALLGHLLIKYAISTTYPPPNPCISNESQLGYVNGTISATQTFLNCLSNIPDATMLPSFYNGVYNGIVNFAASLTLSNLISVSYVHFS